MLHLHIHHSLTSVYLKENKTEKQVSEYQTLYPCCCESKLPSKFTVNNYVVFKSDFPVTTTRVNESGGLRGLGGS